MTAPVPPKTTPCYVHTHRAIAGVTFTMDRVLPDVIRDPQELHVATLMNSESPPSGCLQKATVSITGGAYVEVTLLKPGGHSGVTHVALNDIVAVSHELPPEFGVEAVGHPISGLRVTLQTIGDKLLVIYTTAPPHRDAWMAYFNARLVHRRRQRAAVAQRKVEQQAVSADDVNVDDLSRYIDGAALHGAATAASTSPRHDRNSLALNESLLDEASLLMDLATAALPPAWPAVSHVSTSSPQRAAPAPTAAPALISVPSSVRDPRSPRGIPKALLAGAVLPPLEYHASGPSLAHCKWRFDERLALWPSAPADELELMRALAQLQCPGRWSETGQCDPDDAEGDRDYDGDHREWRAGRPSTAVATARKNFLIGVSVDGRVKTASEQLSQKLDPSQAMFDPTSTDVVSVPSDSNAMPWVALDWELPHETRMSVLWQLAHVRLDTGSSVRTPHAPIPDRMSADQVPDFWRRHYDAARDVVRQRERSLRERLGVRRVGRGIRGEGVPE
jgi:hypothetical protein